MTRYTARASREDGWWIVTVPELDAVTQAKRLEQVESQARGLIAAWLDVDPDSVEVTVEPAVPQAVSRKLQRAAAARAKADTEQRRAAELIRSAAQDLAMAGLSVRDIGMVLGVSHQYAQRLKAGRTPVETR